MALPEAEDRGAPRSYVVVCRGPHCRERGSLPLRARLRQLLRGRTDVGLIGYACFGQCDLGPNVAFYPEGAWYGGLSQPDAADRVVEHAASGAALPAAPLRLNPDERREHLRNIADLVTIHEQEARRPGARRWWWPFS